MRVTQSMIQTNMLRHLYQSQTKMEQYATRVNTGKKYRFPSEDPITAIKGMDSRTNIAEMEQYKQAISEAQLWLDGTDDVLNSAVHIAQRLHDLAIQAANGTRTAEENKAIAIEAKQLKLQLVDIANAQINDKFIFHGAYTNIPPFKMENEMVKSNFRDENEGGLEFEVMKGLNFEVNSSPGKIFNEELFDRIETFMKGLENNDAEILNSSIYDLNINLHLLMNGRTEIGAKMNRLELTANRLDQQLFLTKDNMMSREGVEFEEAITDLLTQEVIQQAALASGARMIQTSLLDFLR